VSLNTSYKFINATQNWKQQECEVPCNYSVLLGYDDLIELFDFWFVNVEN